MKRGWKIALVVVGATVVGAGAFAAGKAVAQGGPGGGPGGMPFGGPGMMAQGFGPGGPGMMREGEGRGRGPGMMREGFGHGEGHGWRGGHMQGGPGRFGMTRFDKNLTPDEVRRIVDGFLLWRGERQLKAGTVEAGEGNWINFAVVTADNGGFVARFAMDKNTGRVRRLH